jgi:hypothetical protein
MKMFEIEIVNRGKNYVERSFDGLQAAFYSFHFNFEL